MELLPNQIIDALSSDDQRLLNKILTVEKRHLHNLQIKPNSREEKEIITDLIKVIDEAVTDAY